MSQQPPQHTVVQAVHDFLAASVPPGAGIVVAVSGGPDSVALLAALRQVNDRHARGHPLTVSHLDHALRPNSAEDTAFVASLCCLFGLPFRTERIDVASHARLRGLSLEEAARLLRYDFLIRSASAVAATHVAVGHHADDNVETILHRLFRGTHLRGLAGMPASRPLANGLTLIRPLLSCRREQILDFLRAQGLSWRTDVTNADTAMARNYIRQTLLPALRDRLNPRVDEALLRLAAAASDAQALLDQQAAALLDRAVRSADQQAVALVAADLVGQPPMVVAAALLAALRRLDAGLQDLSAEHLTQAAGLPALAPPATIPLPGGFEARRQGDLLVLARIDNASPLPSLPVACPGRTDLPHGSCLLIQAAALDRQAFTEHCACHPGDVEYVDADRLAGPLCVRPWRPGDAFHPLGASGRQSVSDFLTNAKLLRHLRPRTLCLCDQQGIVWLIGHRIDERVQVTRQTQRVFRLQKTGEKQGQPPCIGAENGDRPYSS